MDEFREIAWSISVRSSMDETYVGGKISNKKKLMGQNKHPNKTPVIALVERDSGRVRTQVTRKVTATNVNKYVIKNTENGVTLYTIKSV